MKWSDNDFVFDAKGNVQLPDGGTIWRHGIGTSAAIWQAHLVLARREFVLYRTENMRSAIRDLEIYPNEAARYSPAFQNKGLPTARGFCVNINEFIKREETRRYSVPQAAVFSIESLRRYDAGRYAERLAFPASCRAAGVSWQRGSRDEDREFGIDCYVNGVPVQVKLDTPATGNFFVQTHTNNKGWWGDNLAATNNDEAAA